MAHAEHEYKFIDIGRELMFNPPAPAFLAPPNKVGSSTGFSCSD
jgi:hypothetical protein